jgi:SAM-dependent methyltransferase
MSPSPFFTELLNVFWLRPETAMWRAVDIEAMRDFVFRSPSLDLGCGDGIFSFIRAGGRFDERFDAFRAMSSLESFFDNADVFDHFDASVSPGVVKPPDYQIDIGFDHKENLLKKAGLLGLYKETTVGDANQPLPFADASFSSVFSNIVYWLDEPSNMLAEIRRVLKPGGTACLMLPNTTLPDYSLYNQLHFKPQDAKWGFLSQLDRGRFGDNIKHALSDGAWRQYFAEAGLNAVHHKRHLSKLLIQIWDIGLRPLFPVLLKMVDQVPAENLSAIKQSWIETLRHFLAPMVAMDDVLGQAAEPGFHCYIVAR